MSVYSNGAYGRRKVKCVVFNEQVQHKYSVMDILHMMTHHDLRVYRKKGSKEMHHVQEGYEQSLKNAPYQKGIVFVSLQRKI